MRRSARVRVVLGIALAAAVGLVGLAGCSRNAATGAAGSANSVDTTNLSWDAQALESIGFSPADLAPLAATSDNPTADPSASAGAKPDKRGGHGLRQFKRMRFGFAGRVLHGEAVVQTDEGTKTVVVQRGTVTAVDATSVTVKSADGFVITWKLGDPLRVFERRAAATASAIKVGATVGVAGAKDGDTAVARLVLIPATK